LKIDSVSGELISHRHQELEELKEIHIKNAVIELITGELNFIEALTTTQDYHDCSV
jgi:hypothetical protein